METFGLRGRAALLAACSLAVVALPLGTAARAQTYSSPIALAPNEALLWVVNPDDDSVTVVDTATNRALTTIEVGDEPRSIAIDPQNRFAFVANAAGNSVTVVRIREPDPDDFEAVPTGELVTGAEPWSVVVSPDGRRAFVANSGQDTITVVQVRPGAPRVLGNVPLRPDCIVDDPKRHFQPRGLAVTADNTQLYTARTLSFTPRSNGQQGDDEGKVGVVCRLDIDTGSANLADYRPAAQIRLNPQATGFAFTPPDGFPAAAFPNQLQSIVIRGNRAYLPNIAASPSPPLRFNLDTHAFVNQIGGIGGATQTDRGALNLHLGARTPEAGKKKLFFANVWAIAFTTQSGAGNAYVVSAGSDLLVKLNVSGGGALSFTEDADTTRYIDLNDPENPATAGANAGKNPRGIVINQAGDTAYVTNFVSRNVSVIDLTSDEVVAVIPTSDLAAPGSPEEVVQVGAEMFFSSRGHFDRPGGTTVSTDERLSSEGWQGCASCHFEGLTDGVVWVFGAGPRKSVPLNASFNPANPDEQRVLNYSAIFDEVDDFEANIRNVSGPGNLVPPPAPPTSPLDPNHGLIFGATINDAPDAVPAFLPIANADRPQHTVNGVPALTALREWVRLAVRTPNGPLDANEVAGGVNPIVVARGRGLFDRAGCDNCHGGSHWTKSFKNFTSPPGATEVFTETTPPPTIGNPIGTQYLDEFLEDIGSFNIGVRRAGNPIGLNVGAPEFANAAPNAQGQLVLPDALGRDYNDDGAGDGYNVPSLLGIYAVPPYLHNGACETIFCVLRDVNHRTAGNPTDVLNTLSKRNRVARFVESIDVDTAPFDLP